MYYKYDGTPIAESGTVINGVQLWGTSAVETLQGTALNDVLAGNGGDVLIGGGGDDTYYLQSTGNAILENAGEGIDNVTTWMNYTLAANLENLTVTGDGLYAAGNALDNLIKVGDTNNMSVYGGPGNNVLVGGAGTSTFIVVAGQENDAIYGWHVGDKLRLVSSPLHSFADVQGAMTQQGADVVLQDGASQIVLRDTQVSQFTAADFQLTLDTTKLGAVTFGDEFNSLNLRSSSNPNGVWSTDYGYGGLGSYTLTGNSELEIYAAPGFTGSTKKDLGLSPFSLSNGILDIHAQKVDATTSAKIWNYNYTSGLITTKQSFAQTYGYFEMKAQLPANHGGAWPAFWLVPADGSWPPELDVMEQLSGSPEVIYTTEHSAATGSNTAIGAANFIPDSGGFHTYGVLWTKTDLTWYVDSVEVFHVATPVDMNKPMYMIANLAIGGWSGTPDWTSADMQIDYIHAYSLAPAPASYANALFGLPDSGAWTHTILGSPRADTLSGAAGNDYLDGKAAADTMQGGQGDDTYVVDRATDVVTEALGAGVDTVLSTSSSFTLSANVENLTLMGTSAQTGVGNELNNILRSNDAGSVLSGGSGNDILIAGRGADMLTGGPGSDVFVFKAVPTAAGHVTDFTVGSDMLDLRQIFAAAHYSGTDPIADHHLMLQSNGRGGTVVYFDADGAGAGAASVVTTLDYIVPTSIHIQNDIFFQ